MKKITAYITWVLIIETILSLLVLIPWISIKTSGLDPEFLTGIDSIFIMMLTVFGVFLFAISTIIFVILWPIVHKEKGIPRLDERTKRVIERAGYYTFLITIGVIIILIILNIVLLNVGLPQLDANFFAGITLQCAILSYILLLFIYHKKGDVE